MMTKVLFANAKKDLEDAIAMKSTITANLHLVSMVYVLLKMKTLHVSALLVLLAYVVRKY
jgi:hypothetical protein